MQSLRSWSKETLLTSATVTAATTAAIAWRGRVEKGSALPPLNAVSHIVWGRSAVRQTGASCKYTALGLLLNSLAVSLWGACYEAFFGKRGQRCPWTALWGGMLVSAVAYITDYWLVPKRLTPGFEMRLSNASLAWIYAILAISLPLRSLVHSFSDAARNGGAIPWLKTVPSGK